MRSLKSCSRVLSAYQAKEVLAAVVVLDGAVEQGARDGQEVNVVDFAAPDALGGLPGNDRGRALEDKQ